MPDKDINKSRRARARQVSDKDESSKPERAPNVVVGKNRYAPHFLLKENRHKNKNFDGRKAEIGKKDIADIVRDSKELDSNAVIDENTTVVSKGEFETSNPERDTSPPVKMPTGDETPPVTTPDLTARGTPRIRKPMRSREQVGGDPRLEDNREDVKLGGRIPRELRTKFVAALNEHNLHQGSILTELIESYLEKLENDEPK